MKRSIAVLLLILAVLLTYAPAIKNGFVWDDTALILRDPLIRSWRLVPEGLNHFLFTDATASNFFRPIQRLVYTAEYAAFAFSPAPYHLISVLCHAAAALALFFLAEELLLIFEVEPKRGRLVAMVTALVWAIHPVQSAAVVYISGLADPLAATFGFLGLFLIARSLRSVSKNRLLWLGGAMVAFLLSALSKETGLIFPLLGVALLALRRTWIEMFKVAGVAIFVGVVYLSLRAQPEHIPIPVLRPPPPPLVRPIIVARAVAEYAGLIALPLNLHMDRDVESNPTGFDEASMSGSAWRELQTLLGIVLVGLAAYWMYRAYRRDQPAFVCLVLAAISYLPVSGLVILNASVAEHWIYVPTAFLFLAAALQISEWRRTAATRVAVAVFVAWLLFLGVRTFVRTFDWKDQRTFIERTIASGGNSARMLINLGSLELNEGKLEDAAVHLHTALQKRPDQPLAVLNLAAIALKQNDFKLARELLTRATDMPLVAAQAHEYLAVLEHKESGHIDFMRLRLASRTGTSNWAIEKRYVQTLDAAGATGKGIEELLNCLRTEWYRAESWELLSQLLAKSGKAAESANALAQARAYDVHLDTHCENRPTPAAITPSS